MIYKCFIYILLLSLVITGRVTTNKQVQTSNLTPVKRLTFDQTTAYVEQQKGKPLLVNFWATWCDPCVEELPDLIKLYDTHHQDGLEMVGFSVDFPKDTNKLVKPFVKKHKIPYPVYVCDPDDQDILINHFSPKWSGAVPATFLYDKDGKLVNMNIKKMSYKEMEEFLKPILEQKQGN